MILRHVGSNSTLQYSVQSFNNYFRQGILVWTSWKTYILCIPRQFYFQGQSSPRDKSMKEFKEFLEKNGAALSQSPQFVAYYALPFVPNPQQHPAFEILFEVGPNIL